MMKFTGTKNVTPPDGFRYTFPDGTTIQQIAYTDWLLKIKEHYERNGYHRPDNWVQLAENQLCKLLPPGHCSYEDGNNVMQHIDTRLTAGQIYRGAVALTQLAIRGEKDLVPQAEAESRARECAACCANINVAGCLPCMGISNLIGVVIGTRTTEADPYLKQCAICKCSTKLITHVKIEVLDKNTTEEQYQQYQMVGESCWKARELKALREQAETAA